MLDGHYIFMFSYHQWYYFTVKSTPLKLEEPRESNQQLDSREHALEAQGF
jgi:hypothetical protein